MSLKLKVSMALFLNLVILSAYAQDVSVDLRMPSKYFIPGSIFSIDAVIHNTGETYPNAKLFGALTIGTGDYWFYPSWTHYPDGIDWETKTFEELSDQTVSILPAFPWPTGAGDFSGAMLISAVVSETGDLISNVETIDFGWLTKPQIDTVDPSTAPPGKPLKLIGRGLNYPDLDFSVKIGTLNMAVIKKGTDESGNDFLLTVVPFLAPAQYPVTVEVNGYQSQPLMLTIEDVAPTGKLPTATLFVPTPTLAAPIMVPIRTHISDAITPVRTPTWTPGPGTPSPTPTPPPAITGFVYIAPGSFTMGSPSDEPCRTSSETQHQVTLTRGFYMMRTEVTRQMWAELRWVQPTLPFDWSDNGASPTMNHPVQHNSWYDSILFANLMSVQHRYLRCYYKDAEFSIPVDVTNFDSGSFYCNFNANGYRLPTEAEWEFACRAGTTGPFSCSEPNYNSDTCHEGILPTLVQYCVYCENEPGSTMVAGSKLPNPAGLYDIHGNVWEWCWDWYGTYPSGNVTDPAGPASGSYRVYRGGGWSYFAKHCRSADRLSYDPAVDAINLGFRLLRSYTSGTPTMTPIRTPISDAITPVRTPTWTPGPGTPTPSPTPPPAITGFVYIAPGSFTMGSPYDEACRFWGEMQHQVTLTRGFYMMQTEVTRQMWADLQAVQPTLPTDPSYTNINPTMNHPVQNNTWYESILFANLMSVQYGCERCYYKDAGFSTPLDATNYTSGTFYCNFNANGYRLPTESEWEFACRAGTTGPFSCSEPNYIFGNCQNCVPGTFPTLAQYCVYCANDPGGTEVVGSKLPNPAGLYDIHGNVWEWCWDWNATYPPVNVTDPTGPASGSNRVKRGGGWYDGRAQYCRSAMRGYNAPYDRHFHLGFRLLRSYTSGTPTMTPKRTQISGAITPVRTPTWTPTVGPGTPPPPPEPITGFV